MLAFYYHQVIGDFKKAKKLYKHALRRTEFPNGCYNMLLAIYLHDITFNCKSQGDYIRVKQKLQKLDDQFDHFF